MRPDTGPVQRCTLATPLGDMLAAAQDGKLCGLWFTDQKQVPAEAPHWAERPEATVFTQLSTWLEAYFHGNCRGFEVPLSPAGTVFQRTVWTFLRTIPFGQTRTYGQVAAALGLQPGAARAVGMAVGCNPLLILVPCHRVIGANGRLVGYAAGLDRKKALLELEAKTRA